MQSKLAKRFVIICSASLLTLMPACGGQQSPQIDSPPANTSNEETNKEDEATSPQENVVRSFEAFKTKIDLSLKTLHKEQTIDDSLLNEALNLLNTFQESIKTIENLNTLRPETLRFLKIINLHINDIKSYIDEIKTFPDNVEDNPEARKAINKYNKYEEYTPEKIERIEAMVAIIPLIKASALEPIKPIDIVIYTLLIVLIFVVVIQIFAKEQLNRELQGLKENLSNEIEELKENLRQGNGKNGGNDSPPGLVSAIEKFLAPLSGQDSSQLSEFLGSYPKISASLQQLVEKLENLTSLFSDSENSQLVQSLKFLPTITASLQQLEKLDNLISLFSDPEKSQLVKSLKSLPTITASLQKLDNLKNLDSLQKLSELDKISILIDFVQSIKDSQNLPTEDISDIKTFLKLITDKIEHIEQTYSDQKVSVKSSSAIRQQPKIGRETSKPTPVPTNSGLKIMPPQSSILGSKTEEETTVSPVKSEQSQLPFDYDSIPLPQNLIDWYQKEPQSFEIRCRKVEQSFEQIQHQSAGDPNLIFELVTKSNTPYWLYSCEQRNSDEHLYWLFLAPNQQLTESNIPILKRCFLGKIDPSWKGKKWKLEEPALLKTIQGETKFQLVKQGKLMLDM